MQKVAKLLMALLLLFALGSCDEPEIGPDGPEPTLSAEEEADEFLESIGEPIYFDESIGKIAFQYSGENQPYHTGLRNQTVFIIDYGTNDVYAEGEKYFEEPAGTNRTRVGKDIIEFKGEYDEFEYSITGDLMIYSEGFASGSGDGDDFLTYRMNGKLFARYENEQWVGTVTGSATLKQEWRYKELDKPDDVTEFDINWTIVGTSIEEPE